MPRSSSRAGPHRAGHAPKPAAVVAHFEARFGELGTAARAASMKAYMKSALRFHGVDAKQLRAACAAFCTEDGPLPREQLVAYVDALFATDGFDLRSAAITLLERSWKQLAAADLPWLVELARAGACWAHVDFLVTKVIAPVLARELDLARWIAAWARDPDFWIRRVALLAQLRALRRGGGDFALFARIAAPMLSEREFFIRKAIGWVLREVSKQRPALVRDFLLEHAGACSGVTWREAVKYLPSPMARTAEARRRAGA
ncbi:MAG TPA: DNA alkylation repair protein [Kofleriaceae bacterium]|nr:DNA alkylation repair protein [Kofleriaceae bacterium]